MAVDIASDQATNIQNEYGWTNLGKRHIVVFMGFLFGLFITGHLLLIAVALLSMVKHVQTKTDLRNNGSIPCRSLYIVRNETISYVSYSIFKTEQRNNGSIPCSSYKVKNETILQSTEGEFEWDSILQGSILSANLFGYIFTQVAGGLLAEKFGAKVTLVWAHLLIAFFTVMTPWVARWNVYLMIVAQFVKGLFQGVVLPAITSMLGVWSPKSERGLLNSFFHNGACVGIMLCGALTGWLCSISSMGWPSPFYVIGSLTALTAIVFHFIHSETPRDHPTISKVELNYITNGQEDDMSRKRPPAPWRQILTSVPVHAALIGFWSLKWMMTYFFAIHPTYVGTVLHLPIEKNGWLSTLPFLLTMVGNFISSLLCNWLQKKDICRPGGLRKGCTGIGCLGFCLSFLGVYFAGCNPTLNWVFFAFACFFTGINIGGCMIVPADLSPRFAGSVTGISQLVGGIMGAVVPVTVLAMTSQGTIEEWHNVFLLLSALIAFSGLVFIVFGQAEVQPWNYIEEQPTNTHQITLLNNDTKNAIE